MNRLVIPAYGHYDYVDLAARSYLERTPDSAVVVVDDASPDFSDADAKVISRLKSAYKYNFGFIRLPSNAGIHTAWNVGIESAIQDGADVVIAGNSDLYFPEGWHTQILDEVYPLRLCGPVTNAPGPQLEQLCPSPCSSQLEADAVQSRLPAAPARPVKELNGFCMAATVDAWKASSLPGGLFFKPCVEFNSRGKPNPTPRMTLGEYEMQGRMKRAGVELRVCPNSFVYHFRSVTRGRRFSHGQGSRIEEPR